MLKRTVSLILTALLILSVFSGCNLQMTMLPQNTKPASTKPTESMDATGSTDPTQSTGENQPNQSVDLGQPKEDPVRPATMPADVPNLENGVYATCGNYYYTIYMNPDVANEHIQFYLMSEEPLPEDAEIITGLQTNHKVRITNRTPNEMRFNMFLDAVVQGKEIDWTKLYQLERENYDAQLDYLAGKITWDEFQAAARAYWDAWCLLTGYGQSTSSTGGHPVAFYYYEVQIYIAKYQMDEELTSVELVAGDMSRTIPVGNIRLRKQVDPTTTELNLKALVTGKNISASLPIPNITPSAGGDQFVMATGGVSNPQVMKWSFLAREDISLTDAYFFANGGENCKIICADVMIIPTDGIRQTTGDPIQILWTPGTPLQIRKNEFVMVQVCYEDSWYQMVEYAGKQYMVLEYECNAETGRILGRISYPERKWSSIEELYLWAFTDVDVEGYYNEYAIPIKKYLSEIGGVPQISDPNKPPTAIS